MPYRHKPLADPLKQFRLFQILPGRTDSAIECRLRTHSIHNCPKFYAISYCWGSPNDPATIRVNDAAMVVNQNCRYALWQVRQLDREELFFIDSICIDQSNLEEKAAQVQEISSIFQSASLVLASIGPAADDSDFLLAYLQRLLPTESLEVLHQTEMSPNGLDDETERRTINGLVALEDDFNRFAKALKCFSHRPFFSRLWIYQEVYLASDVIMICGVQTARMRALKDVVRVCETLYPRYRPWAEYDYRSGQEKLMKLLMASPLNLFLPTHSGKGLGSLATLVRQLQSHSTDSPVGLADPVNGIVQIQSNIQQLACTDSRDTIYAILGVLGSSCPIVPDYTISALQLAHRVLQAYSDFAEYSKCTELADLLCINLRLNRRTQHIAATLKSEIHSADGESTFGEVKTGYHGQHHTTEQSTRLLRESTPWACRIVLTEGDKLTAPFKVSLPKEISDSKERDRHLILSPTAEHRTIFADGVAVAVVSKQTSAGDWIVPLNHYVSRYYHDFCLGLVLRHCCGNLYEIIGEVAFFPGCTICFSFGSCDCQFGQAAHPDYVTNFTIHFDHADLLYLALRLRDPFVAMTISGDECGSDFPCRTRPVGKSTYATRTDNWEPVQHPPEQRQYYGPAHPGLLG